jgi:hypothetical protein
MATSIPYDDLPDFVIEYGEDWFPVAAKWFEAKGMGLILFDGAPRYLPADIPMIIQGPPFEGATFHHAVVVTSGAVLDPHPREPFMVEIVHRYAVVKAAA